MKFRPDTSTSERQLVLALTADRRSISLNDLALWRKDGLLPPLASNGVGNGRAYYWREPDIQAQAETVYDSLQRHGRVDMAIITLWLNGFAVPLAQLRRAWLSRAKLRKTPRLRRAPAPLEKPSQERGLASLLLQAAIRVGDMVDMEDGRPDFALRALERAMARLDIPSHGAQALWPLAMLAVWTLESSNLIREAEDEELRNAQRYLRIATTFLKSCSSETDQTVLIDSLGAPLFLFFLASLHAGEQALLDDMAARVMATERRALHPPLRAMGMHA